MSKAQSKVKAQTKLRAVPKKTTFSDKEYVAMAPEEDDIATLKDKEDKEIARFLPIEVVERDLDRWPWSTEHFAYQLYTDKSGNRCIAASLELVILWKEDNHFASERRLTGCCNFIIGSYAPNSHSVATGKSECVKNAASDLGRRFGRGLNEIDIAPIQSESPAPVKPTGRKMTPGSDILAKYKAAKEAGDTTAMGIFSDVYEINPEENA